MVYVPRTPPENNVSRTHPLVELATLLGGVAAAAVLLTLAAMAALDWIVPHIPPRLEIRVFGGLWPGAEALGEPDGPGARTRALLLRLATHWEANPYPLQLTLLPAAQPNAFALPGGAVGVTSALLDSVQSENELAFVLGHELGHLAGRHHLQAMGRSLLLSLALAGFHRGGSEALPLTAASLTALRFARDQERAADRFGLWLLAQEYGHLGGAADFFSRLPDAQAPQAGLRVASWLATHPLSADRVQEVKDWARQNGVPLQGPLRPLPWRHQDRR